MYSKPITRRLIGLMTLLTFTLCSCAPPRVHPAVSAYQQLLTAFGSGRSEDVWQLLSRESRVILLERLSSQMQSDHAHDSAREGQIKIEQTSHLNQPPTHFKIELDWALESPFTAQAKLANRSSHTDPSRFQEVSVFYASQSWLIPAIFEDGAWRIHLLGARPAPLTPSSPS